jgi:hypothetical protein
MAFRDVKNDAYQKLIGQTIFRDSLPFFHKMKKTCSGPSGKQPVELLPCVLALAMLGEQRAHPD